MDFTQENYILRPEATNATFNHQLVVALIL